MSSDNSRSSRQRRGSHEAGAHAAPSSHTPQTRGSHAAHSTPAAPRRPRREIDFPWGPVLGVGTALLLVVGLVLFALFGVFRIRYVLPDGSEKTELVLRGRTPASVPSVWQGGYTFLGWEDEEGTIVPVEETPVFASIRLVARMIPGLISPDHAVYLFPDDNGFILPDGAMTRGETAQILYGFLAVPVAGTSNYADVAPDAPYAEATAALKTLEVVPGDAFRPEEEISLRGILELFGSFYPQLTPADIRIFAGEADPRDPEAEIPYILRYTFADIGEADPDYLLFCTAADKGWIDYGPDVLLDPDKSLSRGEIASFVNRLLGRGQGLEVSEAEAGILIDLPLDHPLYTDLMEAAVPHTPRMADGAETWPGSQPFVSDLEEGLFFIGLQMYCGDENGYLVKNSSWNGFDFGPDGRFTSGMEELDELVRQALEGLITEDMDDDARLRAIYDYTVHNFTYLKGNTHKRGDVSWSAEEAYTMLSTGYNNCYGFAAVFYELARALGFDATLISGLYGTNYLPHAWVEFTVDGERRICDPEVEWTYYYHAETEPPYSLLMMTVSQARRWGYTK